VQIWAELARILARLQQLGLAGHGGEISVGNCRCTFEARPIKALVPVFICEAQQVVNINAEETHKIFSKLKAHLQKKCRHHRLRRPLRPHMPSGKRQERLHRSLQHILQAHDQRRD
jgi:hypothetical protein